MSQVNTGRGASIQSSIQAWRAPNSSLTSIVRPFQSRARQNILDRIERLRAIAGESDEPTLCIGGPANLSPPLNQPTFPVVNWPDDHDEEEEGIERPRYKELQAVVRKLRVTNPEHADMYVDILARNASLLQTDQGNEFWIDWLQDLTQQERA